jgi:hypothetical protein
MAAILSISDISQEAKTYQQQLRFLPYFILGEQLGKLGIQLMQVAGTDVITQSQRKGGLLKPYDADNIDYSAEMMKFREAELVTKTAVISLKDSIKNYSGKKLMNVPSPGTAFNQTKKHPFQDLITSGIVTTAAEDILDALFGAEYDKTDRSPLGCFDGYDTLIADLIASIDIAEAVGNVNPTGSLTAPSDEDDYDTINSIVDFVRGGSSFLLRNGMLLLSRNVYRYAVDALENKYKYKAWDLNGVQQYLNDKCGSNIVLVPNEFMGTGDRLMLTIPGNLHFGMDTFGDQEFVQVRTPYEDPNLMQFWLQADFGARIVSIHKKEFMINDGTPAYTALAGDYES